MNWETSHLNHPSITGLDAAIGFMSLGAIPCDGHSPSRERPRAPPPDTTHSVNNAEHRVMSQDCASSPWIPCSYAPCGRSSRPFRLSVVSVVDSYSGEIDATLYCRVTSTRLLSHLKWDFNLITCTSGAEGGKLPWKPRLVAPSKTMAGALKFDSGSHSKSDRCDRTIARNGVIWRP